MIHTFPTNDFQREARIIRSMFNKDIYEILKRLDAIVAGGTLTSLFSNREVNDLDIYFRSWDDLEVFITYLHDKELRDADHDLTVHTMGWNKYKRSYRRFKELDGIDLAVKPFKIATESSIQDQKDGCSPLPITSAEVESNIGFNEFLEEMVPYEEMECGDYVRNLGMTDKSVMYSNRTDPVMQVIAFGVFPTPQDIFNKFDFTINMGAFCFKDESWHFDNNFLKHVAQKVLVVNPNTDYPIISLLRASKYAARGYTISRRETMKLGLSTSKLNISSWEDAKKHLSGMYGTNVETLFTESRPFSFELLFDKLDNAGDKIISMIATDKEKGDRSKINNISLNPVDQFSIINRLRYHTGRPHFNKMWGVCKSKNFYLMEPENHSQKVHVGMTDVDEQFHYAVEMFFEEKDARSHYAHQADKGGAVLLQVDILNVDNLRQKDHDTGSVTIDHTGSRRKPTTPSAIIRKYISSNGDFT